jgi:hypothetical protein
MEKKIITKTKHTYHLANPYNGGAQALFYKADQIQASVANNNLLNSQADFLQLILRNPIHLN